MLAKRIALAVTFVLLFRGLSEAAWIGLAWDANPEPNIAGYVVMYGTSSRNYTQQIDVGRVTTYAVPGLSTGQRYYLAVKAYNTSGAASTASAEVSGIASATDSILTLGPSTLQFGATKLGAAGALTAVTPAQTVTVGFVGATPTWTVAVDRPWVQVTNASGTGAGAFTVSIANPGNVLGGATTATATVTLTASNVGVTKTMPVSLTIDQTGSGAAPFGSFDTPVDGAAGLTGSIAVTGWALDDVGISRVEIWRDVAPGETTPPYQGGGPRNGKIYVADATFIAGSRPDVEGAYGSFPMSSRAGWGYLLLTWGLWNRGNGTYALYAIASDQDGHTSLLGIKRITVDNAHAAKPFGALDTPGIGQTVSGTIWNYGWALTPGTACSIPSNGVSMAVDSGALVPVTFGAARTDIASAFAGFTNATKAGGAVSLDTSTLAPGTHQIGWYVVDSCGRADGIGSRFFNVATAGSALTASAASSLAASTASGSEASLVDTASVDVSVNGNEWHSLEPAGGGTRVVELHESDRLDLQLPSSASTGAMYAGYQLIAGERRPLPIGSSLDAVSGRFSWHPAAGFLGAYDLLFVRSSVGGSLLVRIVIGPPLRAVVDTPVAQSVVPQSFVLSGWALDLTSTSGSGIGAVHVWAYPTGGTPPIFLGEAALGGARADVAAVYGSQFSDSSYTLAVQSLAPGAYDVVVYVRRRSSETFDGAQVLRLVVQ